jgi:hypothetical protein
MLRTGLHGHSGPGVVPVSQMVSGAMGIPLWWDPLGENLPVVGAYRAIATVGSPWPLAPANYADTLQNWSNPGVNDLVQISGLPAPVPWALNTGWQFITANNDAFDTGITPATDQTWSAICQFNNVLTGNVDFLFGCANNAFNVIFGIQPNRGVIGVGYWNNRSLLVAPELLAGNLCIAGVFGYRNGAIEPGNIGAPWVGNLTTCYIGANNRAGVGSTGPITGNVESFAIYSGTLTAPQVLAVATAMAAL